MQLDRKYKFWSFTIQIGENLFTINPLFIARVQRREKLQGSKHKV
jgi:hypothetical protein